MGKYIPEGAITDKETFDKEIKPGDEFFIVHNYYIYHNLESARRVMPFRDSMVDWKDWDKSKFFWYKPSGREEKCGSFIDRNIPPNKYNGHFIFKDKEKAESYHAWSKIHRYEGEEVPSELTYLNRDSQPLP